MVHKWTYVALTLLASLTISPDSSSYVDWGLTTKTLSPRETFKAADLVFRKESVGTKAVLSYRHDPLTDGLWLKQRTTSSSEFSPTTNSPLLRDTFLLLIVSALSLWRPTPYVWLGFKSLVSGRNNEKQWEIVTESYSLKFRRQAFRIQRDLLSATCGGTAGNGRITRCHGHAESLQSPKPYTPY